MEKILMRVKKNRRDYSGTKLVMKLDIWPSKEELER